MCDKVPAPGDLMCKDHQSKDVLLSANKTSILHIREFLIRSHSLRKLKINKFTYTISSLLFPEHHLKSLQMKQNHLSLWSQSQPGNHFPAVELEASVRCPCGSAASMALTYVHMTVVSNWQVRRKQWP